jgi:colicin import membrane protein
VSAAALNPIPGQPRSADGMVPGASLALVVHVALVGALALGVDWRRHSDAVHSAELWSALPQVAAPRAPRPEPSPPPPPPPAPAPAPAPPPAPTRSAVEIAIEKEKLAQTEREARLARQREAEARRAREAEQAALKQQRELQRQRQEEQARQAEEARQAALEQARLDKLRKENLDRMLAQAGGTGSPNSRGTAAQDSAASQAYRGILTSFLREQIVMPDRDRLPKTLKTTVEMRATTSGTVLSRRVVTPSGNADWDEAVLRGIDKVDKLPRNTDGRAETHVVADFTPFD